MKPIFFFGTLRDRALLAAVLGREVGAEELRPARAPDRRAWRVRGEAYPMLRHAPGQAQDGVLFAPAAAEEIDSVAYYEEAEYGLAPIEVETAEGRVSARHFDATDRLAPGEGPWDFDEWAARHRDVAIEAAAELMPLRRSLPVEEINAAVWPGIMNRARQRARARAETPVLAGLRTAFDRERDVAWERHERPFEGYLAVERHLLRHRLFSGGMSAPVQRETAGWGDAVTVLPWDPVRDRVLLIEQFRPGPAARCDPNPWCIEVPAGRIDGDEDAETAIRREAREEAGVTLGRVHRLPGYYPTPGLASEHLGAFIGEADLGEAGGGVHGAADEGEDIRTLVLDTDAALDALSAGAVNTGPAQILLLWLAREREALAGAWR